MSCDVAIAHKLIDIDLVDSLAIFYKVERSIDMGSVVSTHVECGQIADLAFVYAQKDLPLGRRISRIDYQFSRKYGAFASVGWGLTRYYDRNETYRNRPLVELGLTYRQPRNQHDSWKQAWAEKRSKLVFADSTMALPTPKRPWQALAEVTGINVGVQLFDRWALNSDFAQTTLNSLKHNFTDGMVWDNDFFITNMFAHPYHGNLYFNAARTNGLTFWESAPFSLLGSAMWEFLGETEPPAINDIIATTCGGIAIGEMTHRLSLTILDDRERGFNRFLREAVATIVNPIQGLHRIISGDAVHGYAQHP